MVICLLLMLFFPPLYHLWLIIRKFRRTTKKSMTVLTMMAISLQTALTIVVAIIYDQRTTSEIASPLIKCDMTPVIFTVFEPLVAFFIMPVIGIISGIIWHFKNTNANDKLNQSIRFPKYLTIQSPTLEKSPLKSYFCSLLKI